MGVRPRHVSGARAHDAGLRNVTVGGHVVPPRSLDFDGYFLWTVGFPTVKKNIQNFINFSRWI